MNTYTSGFEEKMLVCFGRNLKHFRERKGMTLRQLGDVTGISYSYLGKMEARPELASGITLRKICTIANALDVPAEALLFDVKQRERKSIVRQASRRIEELLKDALMMASVIDEHI